MTINNQNNFSIVIGNFDGCHLGHQYYIETATKEANKIDCELLVVTFSPHPVMVLKPQQNYLLSVPSDKLIELKGNRDLKVIEIEFTRDLSNLTGIDFLKRHVLSPNLKAIFWGHDLKIGMDRFSDVDVLKNDDAFRNIIFKKLDPLIMNGQKVCSSLIRQKLSEGLIEEANLYLGRKYKISGNVMRGFGRGAQIGIRTANLDFDKSRLIPGRGVYLTKTQYGDEVYTSVTNIGFNPTFGLESLSVETHLLDFDKLIYGEKIEISFLLKIRDEKKFASVPDLVEQIKKDVIMAKNHV